MSFGSDPNGSFNSSSLAYKDNPTIQNYLALRRENPSAEIEVSALGGYDSVVAMQPELEAFGIALEDILGVLDADQDALSKVSLLLLQALADQEDAEKRGETHLVSRGEAIPLALTDWIIALALEAMSWTNEMQMNRDLIVLVKARLVGNRPKYTARNHVRQSRKAAVWIGGQMLAQGRSPSIRGVAELLGLSPSTVSRWFETGEFGSECREVSVLFDSDGRLKPLVD